MSTNDSAADFENPAAVARRGYLAVAKELDEKSVKTRKEAQEWKDRARYFAQKGMPVSAKEATETADRLDTTYRAMLGYKTANEDAARMVENRI